MENIKNDHIVEVVENILEYPGDTMPLDLAEELMDYLCDATLATSFSYRPGNSPDGITTALCPSPSRIMQQLFCPLSGYIFKKIAS